MTKEQREALVVYLRNGTWKGHATCIVAADLIEAQAAEIDRLREALMKIIAKWENYISADPDDYFDGYDDGLHDAANIARAALGND